MIREMKEADIDIIMEIWKKSTIKAHSFISETYWLESYNLVKEQYIPMSKTFVYEDSDGVKGFISIIEDVFIGALFVDVKWQGQGIGARLIDFVKKDYKKLSLAVYKENEKSVKFYEKMGFSIEKEQTNESTNEKEYIMNWEKYKS